MKIGIIGTRGIPNHYGGFEQFAEMFAMLMAAKGHSMHVYSSHNHPYSGKEYKGVQILHCYDPEHRVGTSGQFIYDYNCIRDSRTRNFDIILQLGYTSSTVWSWMYPKHSLLVTNMDGLEWKRSKYSGPVQFFLKFAEKWGARYSDKLIADSKGIQDYLREKYSCDSYYVPYGANAYTPQGDGSALSDYDLQPGQYDIVVARFEPENNIETFLQAYRRMRNRRLLLVGNYGDTSFGRKMFREYKDDENVIFANGIYDNERLNVLRCHSRIYYHGHSVGGTNPSLLEAMACGTLICAHRNPFNTAILMDNAFYFSGVEEIMALGSRDIRRTEYYEWLENNRIAIEDEFNWEIITDKLEAYFEEWLGEKKCSHVRNYVHS